MNVKNLIIGDYQYRPIWKNCDRSPTTLGPYENIISEEVGITYYIFMKEKRAEIVDTRFYASLIL